MDFEYTLVVEQEEKAESEEEEDDIHELEDRPLSLLLPLKQGSRRWSTNSELDPITPLDHPIRIRGSVLESPIKHRL